MSKSGVVLVEILVAIALMFMLLPALITGFVASREGKTQEGNRLMATALLRESKDALRTIRETSWTNLATNGTYYPRIIGSTSWSLVTGTETVNGFTRKIEISDVLRNSNNIIVENSGTIDPSTKKIISTVSWNDPIPTSISSTEYFHRYLQNTTWTQTTQIDFNTGTFSNTTSSNTNGGDVRLLSSNSSGSFIDDYTTPADYIFDSAKIEVTGGYAQLHDTSTLVSASSSNSTFDTNTSGWTYGEWGTTSAVSGTRSSTGGNPNGAINVTFSSTRNVIAGGYWQQPITTTMINPSGSLTFQWSVTQFQGSPNPDSFRLYAFVDSTSGTPTLAQAIWNSGEIVGTSGWSGTVTVNVSSKIQTSGTYYLKLASYLDYTNASNRGPFKILYDNVQLNSSGQGTPSYSSTNPTIYESTSFTNANITSWSSFSSVEVPNGGSIRYQLSTDDGVTWLYHNGTNWVTASATNYNTTSQINSAINTLSSSTKKIRVKAFLISNGTQLVKLDSITIGYNGISSGANFGTFTSSTFDANSTVGFNRIQWNATNTSNTSSTFQIATNSDNSTWNFVGPDGTTQTFFSSGGAIPLNSVSGRYFRYRVNLSSSNTDIPTLNDVIINYSP
ncbi:MAG: hypothetical protein WCO06_03240 [Candidatus Roizmanbacteria bacterium]